MLQLQIWKGVCDQWKILGIKLESKVCIMFDKVVLERERRISRGVVAT